jgi:hypothetical protein
MRDRLSQEPVREPRIPGQERAVQIGADRAAEAAALVAALAVVAETGDDPPERLGIVVEERPTGMVLESRERLTFAALELAFDQNVADHPA